MNTNDYTITPAQVLAFAGSLPIPAKIEVRQGEVVVNVPLFISTNLSRMYCGATILEKSARRKMMALAAMITQLESLNNQ